MKITFILPAIGIGGGTRVVFEYANHLVERGHNVSVIFPSVLASQLLIFKVNPNRFRLKKLLYHAITLFKISSKSKVIENIDLYALKAKLIEVPTLNEKYIPDADVIIATWWETAFYVNDYNKTKGKKFYLVQHYETWGGPKELVQKTYKLNLKKIVIAKWLYDKLMKLGVPKSQVDYIPNAINFKIFKLTENIENRPKRIAMQFSENIFKGIFDGIDALELTKKQVPDLEAVLFGISSRPTYLPTWIEYIQNPSQEELVKKIYNKSSIYLCPSWTEGWGLPGTEAMACGCALVSTINGGVEDYAIDEKTALLSPPKNPNLLAKNLLKLLIDENVRLRLAYAGYDNIKNFDWERSTNKLETLFKTF